MPERRRCDIRLCEKKSQDRLWLSLVFANKYARQIPLAARSFYLEHSTTPAVDLAYIRNQKAHHQRMNFKEEFVAFLKRHGIEYDERYVLGLMLYRTFGARAFRRAWRSRPHGRAYPMTPLRG